MAALWRSHNGSPTMPAAALRSFMTAGVRRLYSKTWNGSDI